jgi:hypothetical protein
MAKVRKVRGSRRVRYRGRTFKSKSAAKRYLAYKHIGPCGGGKRRKKRKK